MTQDPSNNTIPQTITLGGGCFWCTEAVFVQVRGIQNGESGYSNGHVNQAVCLAGKKETMGY